MTARICRTANLVQVYTTSPLDAASDGETFKLHQSVLPDVPVRRVTGRLRRSFKLRKRLGKFKEMMAAAAAAQASMVASLSSLGRHEVVVIAVLAISPLLPSLP